MRNRRRSARNSEAGKSFVEIIIVLVIIGILAAVSLPYIANYRKLYRSEDQALKIMDLLREAAQLSVTQRRTIRFEIDLTENAILLIDQSQNSPAGRRIKKVPLDATGYVRVDMIPSNIPGTAIPPTNPPTNYTNIAFSTDAVGHLAGATTVTGHSVWQARFRQDGSVVNMNATPVPINANIYIWPPVSSGSNAARNKNEIRAITMFGGSGAIRYWKYANTAFVANQ
ncbi:MAG: hypothetical protein ACKVRN_13540 [Pyrinomonadaceae bacterium]